MLSPRSQPRNTGTLWGDAYYALGELFASERGVGPFMLQHRPRELMHMLCVLTERLKDVGAYSHELDRNEYR